MLLDLLVKKEYKLDYSPLKGMAENRMDGVDKHRTCPTAEYLKKKNSC